MLKWTKQHVGCHYLPGVLKGSNKQVSANSVVMHVIPQNMGVDILPLTYTGGF